MIAEIWRTPMYKGLFMSSRLIFAFLFALLVAACNRNPLEVVVSRCPAVAVVGDVGTVTKFIGEDRLQEELVYTASLSEIETNCREGGSVEANVAFKIVARAGDAHSGGPITLPYFVAVLKDNSQLITKKTYTATLNLSAEGRAVSVQQIEGLIPTIDQARKYNYEILIGFQIEPGDVYYNMIR